MVPINIADFVGEAPNLMMTIFEKNVAKPIPKNVLAVSAKTAKMYVLFVTSFSVVNTNPLAVKIISSSFARSFPSFIAAFRFRCPSVISLGKSMSRNPLIKSKIANAAEANHHAPIQEESFGVSSTPSGCFQREIFEKRIVVVIIVVDYMFYKEEKMSLLHYTETFKIQRRTRSILIHSIIRSTTKSIGLK